jgi:Phage capsid family
VKSLHELALVERNARLGEFAQFCRLLAINKGNVSNAAAMAASQRVSGRVVEAFKDVVPAGGAGLGAWGEQLSPARLLASAFQETLRYNSAVYRMFADGAPTRVPLNVIIGTLASTSTAGSSVEAGEALPLLRADLDHVTIDRRKAGGVVALSNELLRDAPVAEALITRFLRNRVAEAVDADVFSILLTGLTPMTTQGLLVDVRNLLNAVGLTPASRPYWLVSPSVAVTMATSNTDGQPWFPAATALGGEVGGIPVLVSAGIPAATLALVDAARIAGNVETPVVSLSTQATIEMDTAPTGHGGAGSPIGPVGATAAQVNLWQQDATAIKAMAYYGIARMDGNAIASVFVGGSP